MATTGTAAGLAGGETGKPLMPLTMGQAAATTVLAMAVKAVRWPAASLQFQPNSPTTA